MEKRMCVPFCLPKMSFADFMTGGGKKDMELTQIRYFLEVADTKHMTNSAKNLHITQPALTQAIRRLEEEGKAFVICPGEELGMGRTCREPEEIQRVYDTGRGDAVRQLGNLEVFLG